ncbi:MAG TPA: DM13 domain-containing protein [Aestuariivirga sp.]|mgnify:FL=1|nr:DM13 domain-containing protein [Hyphomicrobiales bacterium]HQY72235.1 DM13 domain-containing protein [Aestuariivirga sp.]HRA93507.1 DM13 domain-containing protein [Aestuariivirga sp.]
MSRKLIATAIIAGTIGFVAGNAFWYLASPLWIDRVVAEELPVELQMKTAAMGEFRDADSVHHGKGTATIFENDSGTKVLRFTNFESTNGPDLKVWLVKAENIKASADVKASTWVGLGPLKGNIGDQNYVIPSDVNLSDYKSVVIWCEQFGVLFSAADLKPGV